MSRKTLLIGALLALLVAAGAAGAAPPSPPTGELVQGVECEVDPTQTYTLYLPSRFDPGKRWPGLLIFDPRGRSVRAAELFRDAAETYGWVLLASDNTRSDGPMEPNRRALDALWPEVHRRYSIDPRRIYAAGFSGGAMLGWELGRVSGALAGVIGSGGRLEAHNFDEEIRFPCFGTAGNTDSNYFEMHRLHRQLVRWGTPERLEIFDGPHRWMPAELAAAGVAWMELEAMKRDLRPRDGALIDELYAGDAAAARELESAGEELSAMRRWAAVAATFEGLREVAEARREAARLAAEPAVGEALKDENKWDAFEQEYLGRMFGAFAVLRRPSLRGETPMTTARLRWELRIGSLQKRAAEPTYEGVVAERLLQTVLTQTSFYLLRELFAAGDYESAAKILTIAGEIAPERADVWYNLACALAQTGSRTKAVEALERAVAAGFSDPRQLESDPDLEPLRRSADFRALVARLGGS
jgi:predicted esterase